MVDHSHVISGNHGLTMVSSTFKIQMTMVNHGQIPDVQTFKLTHFWGMNMAEPWSTMVWKRLDHGQVISGNHGLTMVNHGQFHIQKSNDMMVNHGQIPDVQTFKLIRLWGMNMAEPWSTMVWQCFDHG